MNTNEDTQTNRKLWEQRRPELSIEVGQRARRRACRLCGLAVVANGGRLPWKRDGCFAKLIINRARLSVQRGSLQRAKEQTSEWGASASALGANCDSHGQTNTSHARRGPFSGLCSSFSCRHTNELEIEAKRRHLKAATCLSGCVKSHTHCSAPYGLVSAE